MHQQDRERTRGEAPGGVRRLALRLFQPVDIAALVYFRIAFGGVLLWEVYRYFAHGWIHRYWIDPAFHFTYYGFGWLQPLPGQGMVYLWGVLGVLALCIILGLFYRAAIVLFFLLFTYQFLLEQARYLNHFYFVCLVSFFLIFVPAHRSLSIDVSRVPGLRCELAPAWSLWGIRALMGIAYFFGGVAKLNSDWLHGEPLRIWLSTPRLAETPLIGPYLQQDWMVLCFAYGGLLLDLLIVPCLLWRVTRWPAVLAATSFHVMNAHLFQIGIFPWFSIATTLTFFRPDWPRRPFARYWKPASPEQRRQATPTWPLRPAQRAIAMGLAAFMTVQILLPLRHWLYPGNVSWTEEGHRFAWHMKLRTKRGRVQYEVVDRNTGKSERVHPREFLQSWQIRKMAGRPDMILQLAHYLAELKRRAGMQDVQVFVRARASLNGRPYQDLIDPEVDLASEPRNLWPAPWIVPLTTPLRHSGTGKVFD